MDDPVSNNTACLTPDERREVRAAWRAVEEARAPLADLVEHVDQVNCDDLHDACVRLGNAFEAFEHAVMRSKQIRLLQVTQGHQLAD